MAMANGLLAPDAAAQDQSRQLLQIIHQEIQTNGPLPFARYMELALYTPELGYYCSDREKFGVAGDFITAPELSPLFARTVAKQCRQVLNHLNTGSILEIGAGSGRLAAELLSVLDALGRLPKHYFILEISQTLRARQQHYLQKTIPHYFDQVKWLDGLPESGFVGVILANEVLDAMPVHVFQLIREGLTEGYVTANQQQQLTWQFSAPSCHELTESMQDIMELLPRPYLSEMNLNLSGWVEGLASSLQQGVILFFDYGFPRHEYYHAERTMGTLLCHYQHQAHTDPFLWPGLQDITAHVDFTAVAKAAASHGLAVSGYTTQAHFLLASGIMDQLAKADRVDQLVLRQQAKQLLLPGAMGESFKAMALTQQCDDLELMGFKHNMSHKL